MTEKERGRDAERACVCVCAAAVVVAMACSFLTPPRVLAVQNHTSMAQWRVIAAQNQTVVSLLAREAETAHRLGIAVSTFESGARANMVAMASQKGAVADLNKTIVQVQSKHAALEGSHVALAAAHSELDAKHTLLQVGHRQNVQHCVCVHVYACACVCRKVKCKM